MVSFQIIPNPEPLSIIPLMIIMNHFAGIICEINCNITGMFSIGNTKPDNRIVGNNNPINDNINATCCVCDMIDIKMPRERVVILNNNISNNNKIRLPLTGTPKT